HVKIDRIDLVGWEQGFAFGKTPGKLIQFEASGEVLARGQSTPHRIVGLFSSSVNASDSSSSITALNPFSFAGRSIVITRSAPTFRRRIRPSAGSRSVLM